MSYSTKIFKDSFSLSIDDNNQIIQDLKSIINSGKFINSRFVEKFEKNFSKKININYGIGYSSASTALSSIVNIITDNDEYNEIILPVFGPLPVSMSLINYKKKIVYADVDPKSFLISNNQILNKISKKTKLIIPIHLFGNVLDIKKIEKLVPKQIKIIEDSSQAHGSSIKKIMAGSMGTASIFSFYPTKNLGAFGDAGMILTNNKKLFYSAQKYRNYGLHKKYYKSNISGNNFRMDDFQAAVLLNKLKYLDKWNLKRNMLSREYKIRLSSLPLEFQKIDEGIFSCFHVFAILVSTKLRNKLYNYLNRNGVQASIYYPSPLPFLTGEIKEISKIRNNYPNAYKISKKIICLPIHHNLNIKDIEFICDLIKKFYKKV